MDRRSKRKKLESMAAQSVSPNEAKIAQEKLKNLPPDPEPIFPMIFFNGMPVNMVSHVRNVRIIVHGDGSVGFSWEEV